MLDGKKVNTYEVDCIVDEIKDDGSVIGRVPFDGCCDSKDDCAFIIKKDTCTVSCPECGDMTVVGFTLNLGEEDYNKMVKISILK